MGAEYIQIWCEALICVDNRILRHFFIWISSPKCCQLRPHIPSLVVDVFMTRGHLLHCIDIYIYVCSRVWSIHHLTEGQHKASCCILFWGGKKAVFNFFLKLYWNKTAWKYQANLLNSISLHIFCLRQTAVVVIKISLTLHNSLNVTVKVSLEATCVLHCTVCFLNSLAWQYYIYLSSLDCSLEQEALFFYLPSITAVALLKYLETVVLT